MSKFTKRILVAVVGLSAVFALAGWSSGRGWHCSRGEFNPERVQKHATAFVDDALDDLDATDAQRTKIQSIKDGLLKEGFALHAQKQGLHKEMLAVWESPDPNAANVHARVDAQIDALRAMAHKAADAALEVHKTLTPEQRAEVAEMVREHHGE